MPNAKFVSITLIISNLIVMGFPGGSDGKKKKKKSASNLGDPGSIRGLGRSPGEGNGNPLQNSSLENSMDREAWRATVHVWGHEKMGHH